MFKEPLKGGIETIILQNDMTYKYFDIPQTRAELNTHLVNHPITEVAREQVLKNSDINLTLDFTLLLCDELDPRF